jgi:hypothetical protein
MTTKEILIAARAKIERPECWTQGEFARVPCLYRSGDDRDRQREGMLG